MGIGIRRRGRDFYSAVPGVPPEFQQFTSGNTTNIKSGMASVTGAVASVDFVCAGNSTVAGWGSKPGGGGGSLAADSRRANSWVAYLAVELASTYGITVNTDNAWGGAGFSLANYEVYNPQVSHSGTTPAISGSTLSVGGGTFLTTNTTDTITFTASKAYNRIDVYFVDVNTDITVTPTLPAEVQTITTAGNTSALRKMTLSFPTPTNTFTFKASAAVGFRIIGWHCYNSGDIELRLHNMGWGGSICSQWSPTDTLYRAKFVINLLGAKCAFFGIDLSDAAAATNPATYQTNLTNFMNNIKNAGACSPVGVIDHWRGTSDIDGGGYTVNSTTLTGIYNASRAAFIAAGVPYIDKPVHYGSFAAENAAGFSYDGVHFNNLGYQDEAVNIMKPGIARLLAA